MSMQRIMQRITFTEKKDMETGGKRKNKHELTEQEIVFYKELSTALYNVRSASGKSVYEMARRCGYSDIQMRRFENFDVEKVTPIPAYVMAVYAEACNVKLEDLCEGWLNKNSKPLKKEAHARRIKYITVGENDLLQKMRTIKQIGGVRISELLGNLTRQDLETIYCLKKVEYNGQSTVNGYFTGKNIRHMIYQFYLQMGNDSRSGRENIRPI